MRAIDLDNIYYWKRKITQIELDLSMCLSTKVLIYTVVLTITTIDLDS